MSILDLIKNSETVCISTSKAQDRRDLFDSRWKDVLEYRYNIFPRFNPSIFLNYIHAKYNKTLNLSEFSSVYSKGTIENVASRWGIINSHLSVIKNAYEKGLEYITILEDDVFPTESLYIEINEPPKNWDFIYLGSEYNSGLYKMSSYNEESYTNWRGKEVSYGGWHRVRCWGAFAYIIKTKLYQNIIEDIRDYIITEFNIYNARIDGIYYWNLADTTNMLYHSNFIRHDFNLETTNPK